MKGTIYSFAEESDKISGSIYENIDVFSPPTGETLRVLNFSSIFLIEFVLPYIKRTLFGCPIEIYSIGYYREEKQNEEEAYLSDSLKKEGFKIEKKGNCTIFTESNYKIFYHPNINIKSWQKKDYIELSSIIKEHPLDIIFCCFTLHYAPHWRILLLFLLSRLKENGSFVYAEVPGVFQYLDGNFADLKPESYITVATIEKALNIKFSNDEKKIVSTKIAEIIKVIEEFERDKKQGQQESLKEKIKAISFTENSTHDESLKDMVLKLYEDEHILQAFMYEVEKTRTSHHLWYPEIRFTDYESVSREINLLFHTVKEELIYAVSLEDIKSIKIFVNRMINKKFSLSYFTDGFPEGILKKLLEVSFKEDVEDNLKQLGKITIADKDIYQRQLIIPKDLKISIFSGFNPDKLLNYSQKYFSTLIYKANRYADVEPQESTGKILDLMVSHDIFIPDKTIYCAVMPWNREKAEFSGAIPVAIRNTENDELVKECQKRLIAYCGFVKEHKKNMQQYVYLTFRNRVPICISVDITLTKNDLSVIFEVRRDRKYEAEFLNIRINPHKIDTFNRAFGDHKHINVNDGYKPNIDPITIKKNAIYKFSIEEDEPNKAQKDDTINTENKWYNFNEYNTIHNYSLKQAINDKIIEEGTKPSDFAKFIRALYGVALLFPEIKPENYELIILPTSNLKRSEYNDKHLNYLSTTGILLLEEKKARYADKLYTLFKENNSHNTKEEFKQIIDNYLKYRISLLNELGQLYLSRVATYQYTGAYTPKQFTQQAGKVAIAATIARNGSHGIGSHILPPVSYGTHSLLDNQTLYKYIQQRFDFIAQVTANLPQWTLPVWFAGDLMMRFYLQRHVLDKLVETEKIGAYEYQLVEDIKEIELPKLRDNKNKIDVSKLKDHKKQVRILYGEIADIILPSDNDKVNPLLVVLKQWYHPVQNKIRVDQYETKKTAYIACLFEPTDENYDRLQKLQATNNFKKYKIKIKGILEVDKLDEIKPIKDYNSGLANGKQPIEYLVRRSSFIEQKLIIKLRKRSFINFKETEEVEEAVNGKTTKYKVYKEYDSSQYIDNLVDVAQRKQLEEHYEAKKVNGITFYGVVLRVNYKENGKKLSIDLLADNEYPDLNNGNVDGLDDVIDFKDNRPNMIRCYLNDTDEEHKKLGIYTNGQGNIKRIHANHRVKIKGELSKYGDHYVVKNAELVERVKINYLVTTRINETSFDAIESQLERDIQAAIPGGVVGYQAFYSILENIIRNAAKHDWVNLSEGQKVGKNLEVKIELEEKEEQGVVICKIWTNASRIDINKTNTDRNEIITIRECLLSDGYTDEEKNNVKNKVIHRVLNTRLAKRLTTKDGTWERKHLGLKEIKIAAGFLARYNLDDINEHPEATLLGTNLNAKERKGYLRATAVWEKESEKIVPRLGYKMKLAKPQEVVFCGHNPLFHAFYNNPLQNQKSKNGAHDNIHSIKFDSVSAPAYNKPIDYEFCLLFAKSDSTNEEGEENKLIRSINDYFKEYKDNNKPNKDHFKQISKEIEYYPYRLFWVYEDGDGYDNIREAIKRPKNRYDLFLSYRLCFISEADLKTILTFDKTKIETAIEQKGLDEVDKKELNDNKLKSIEKVKLLLYTYWLRKMFMVREKDVQYPLTVKLSGLTSENNDTTSPNRLNQFKKANHPQITHRINDFRMLFDLYKEQILKDLKYIAQNGEYTFSFLAEDGSSEKEQDVSFDEIKNILLLNVVDFSKVIRRHHFAKEWLGEEYSTIIAKNRSGATTILKLLKKAIDKYIKTNPYLEKDNIKTLPSVYTDVHSKQRKSLEKQGGENFNWEDTLSAIMQSVEFSDRQDDYLDIYKTDSNSNTSPTYNTNRKPIKYVRHESKSRGDFYYENLSGSQISFSILKDPPQHIYPFLKLIVQLYENALPSILIIDERIGNYLEHSNIQDLSDRMNLMRIKIPASLEINIKNKHNRIDIIEKDYQNKQNTKELEKLKENHFRVILHKVVSQQENSTTYVNHIDIPFSLDVEAFPVGDNTCDGRKNHLPSLIVIHYSLIEKLFGGENKKIVGSFINHLKLYIPCVLITSGRGEPAEMARWNAKFIPFSNLENHLLQQYPEKLLLTQILFKTIKRKPLNREENSEKQNKTATQA